MFNSSIQYTLQERIQKLLFYPLCGVCGQYAGISGKICGKCTKKFLNAMREKRECDQKHENGSFLCKYHEDYYFWLQELRMCGVHNEGLVFKVWLRSLKTSDVLNKMVKNKTISLVLLVPSSSGESGLDYLIEKWAEGNNILFGKNILQKESSARQHEKSSNERFNSEIFIRINNLHKNKVLNQNILIFDDVFTTGTSILQSQIALLDAGAKSVEYFTLCQRTLQKEGERLIQKRLS